MDEREGGLPDERAVEQEFSIPADADYRSPADADYTTPGEPMADDEHREERDQDGRGSATPGNPIGED